MTLVETVSATWSETGERIALQTPFLSAILCRAGRKLTAADSYELWHYTRFHAIAESLASQWHALCPFNPLHFHEHSL